MTYRTGRRNIVANVWSDEARRKAIEVRRAKAKGKGTLDLTSPYPQSTAADKKIAKQYDPTATPELPFDEQKQDRSISSAIAERYQRDSNSRNYYMTGHQAKDHAWVFHEGALKSRRAGEMPHGERNHLRLFPEAAAQMDKLYRGRYDTEEDVVSIMRPMEQLHREVPSSLLSQISKKWPTAKIETYREGGG